MTFISTCFLYFRLNFYHLKGCWRRSLRPDVGFVLLSPQHNTYRVAVFDSAWKSLLVEFWEHQFDKKSGMQMGDIISNFKIENPDRPNKSIVYPFALILLLIFGYLNYKRKI